ncbi:MAG TPA: SUMF1/EgtB/PvdO family nonheme iron enzyme, partial [Gemmatimonadaceae bacterium]|nr:SUMF1/EgtB/PvdO family nonheme iron enzyme [Gemmatimonadaceae bacterium]
YPYGDSADAASANTASARRAGPVPVGSFPRGATPEGLQDMSGNVWEWTSSTMQPYPGAPAFASSLTQYRVIRGGAFDTNDALATASVRGYQKATALPDELPNTGFRCAANASR